MSGALQCESCGQFCKPALNRWEIPFCRDCADDRDGRDELAREDYEERRAEERRDR